MKTECGRGRVRGLAVSPGGRIPGEAPGSMRLNAAGIDRRSFLVSHGVALGVFLFGGPLLGTVRAGSQAGESREPRRASAALLAAIDAGDLPRLKSLLRDHPGGAHSVDEKGRSVFLRAHLVGQPAAADLLKDQGLELDLVEAIADGDNDLVYRLAERDADRINDFHPVGGTAYYAAALFGNAGAMWPLNRWAADPNANPRGDRGVTALRAVFEGSDRSKVKEAAIRILVDAGDPKAAQKNGESVLHAAAAFGDPELVGMIVRKGGDPGSKNDEGKTALEVARTLGHEGVVQLLSRADEIPRDHSSSRRRMKKGGEAYRAESPADLPPTLVNEFAEVCHYDFTRIKELVRDHPKIVHGNATWDEIGVEACAHMGRPDWVTYLLDRDAPLGLATAVMLGEGGLVKKMLEEEPDRIRERGPHDFPLMWYPGIGAERVEMAELLLSRGAHVDEEKMGVTLLHRAAYSGQLDIVRFLLERGADPSRVGRSDFSDLQGTPLDFARAQGQRRALALLGAAKERE